MFQAETERDRFARVLFYAVVLVIGYLAFRIVGPFLAPLAWAGASPVLVYNLLLLAGSGRLATRAVSVNVALRLPAAVGVKVALIVQVPPAATVTEAPALKSGLGKFLGAGLT